MSSVISISMYTHITHTWERERKGGRESTSVCACVSVRWCVEVTEYPWVTFLRPWTLSLRSYLSLAWSLLTRLDWLATEPLGFTSLPPSREMTEALSPCFCGFFFFRVLELGPRASCLKGKHVTRLSTESSPLPCTCTSNADNLPHTSEAEA